MTEQGDAAGAGAVRPPNAAFLLIALGRSTAAQTEAGLKELGLAMRHLSALGHLARRPGLSYSELARRAGITVQSMQATIDQLEQRGAVSRTTEPGRGRRARLEVTTAGQDLLVRAEGVLERADARLVDVLGDQAHGELTDLLTRAFAATRPG